MQELLNYYFFALQFYFILLISSIFVKRVLGYEKLYLFLKSLANPLFYIGLVLILIYIYYDYNEKFEYLQKEIERIYITTIEKWKD